MKFTGLNIGLKVFILFLAIFSRITQTYLRQPVKLFLLLIALSAVLSIVIDVYHYHKHDMQ
jgi:hypothetical protein